MKAAYINLDTAVGRRAQVEASFAAAPHEGWQLVRFAAVTAAEMAHAPGTLRPAEKACFESHRRLIGAHLDDDGPLFVLEDDVAFSQMAFPFLRAMAGQAGDWDVLFTDLAFIQLPYVVEAARERDALAQAGEVRVLPLKGAAFVGATAYLIRGEAKAKLHALLAEVGPMDEPYDLHLRDMVAAGRLKASVCLPFLTTLSTEAEASQIQEATTPQLQAMDAFRRMMFVERDLAASRREADAIRGQLPEADQIAGDLIAALVLARR